MIIKDWIYAWNVCRKYGVKWNPSVNLERAHFTFWYEDKKKPLIELNPFHENFKTVFLHEIGHIVFWRKRGKRFYSCLEACGRHTAYLQPNCNGRSFIGILEEESLASRFSAKVMKTEESRGYLLKAFYTYTAAFYSTLAKLNTDGQDITITTDTVYSCIRRIEK